MINVSVTKMENVKFAIEGGHVAYTGWGVVNSNGDFFADNCGEVVCWKKRSTAASVAKTGLLDTANFKTQIKEAAL